MTYFHQSGRLIKLNIVWVAGKRISLPLNSWTPKEALVQVDSKAQASVCLDNVGNDIKENLNGSCENSVIKIKYTPIHGRDP